MRFVKEFGQHLIRTCGSDEWKAAHLGEFGAYKNSIKQIIGLYERGFLTATEAVQKLLMVLED